MSTIYYYTNEDWANLELFEKRRGKVHDALIEERKRKLWDRLFEEEE